MASQNPYASPKPASSTQPAFEPLNPPQVVEFQFDEDDLRAVTVRGHAVSNMNDVTIRHGRRKLYRATGIMLACCVGCVILGGLNQPYLYLLAIYCMVRAVMHLVKAHRYPDQVNRQVDKMIEALVDEGLVSGRFELTTVTLRHDCIETTDSASSETRQWWSVAMVERFPEYLFVHFGGGAALAVPATAFVNESGFLAFCDLAERLWRMGKAAKQSKQSPGG